MFEIIKALHILSVISWMAGMLYLPRIFVYHTQVKKLGESDVIFQTMEKKLLRYIINPAMILTFLTGLGLIHFIGFESGWLHAKITLVLILAGFHGFLARWRKDFVKGENKRSEKFYRIVNEIPALLMIGIVFLVILKPF